MRCFCQDDWTGSLIKTLSIWTNYLHKCLNFLIFVLFQSTLVQQQHSDQRRFEINLTSECPESASELKSISDSSWDK